MTKTKINQGCGVWNIEYSDDGQTFKVCSTFNIDSSKEISWDSTHIGKHRYWRYNLKTNTGTPYYHGY